MATNKKVKSYVQIFFLKEKENRISVIEMRASRFDEKKITSRCCGYRFFKALAKNGLPEGNREYEKFICKNGASIIPKEDMNTDMLKNIKEHNCTHLIRFRNYGYSVDLA